MVLLRGHACAAAHPAQAQRKALDQRQPARSMSRGKALSVSAPQGPWQREDNQSVPTLNPGSAKPSSCH